MVENLLVDIRLSVQSPTHQKGKAERKEYQEHGIEMLEQLTLPYILTSLTFHRAHCLVTQWHYLSIGHARLLMS